VDLLHKYSPPLECIFGTLYPVIEAVGYSEIQLQRDTALDTARYRYARIQLDTVRYSTTAQDTVDLLCNIARCR